MVTLFLFLIGVLSLLILPPELTAFSYSSPWLLKIVQAFSSMLSHANWEHLLGNFLYGAPYMLYAEHKLKSWKRFLGYYVAFGLAALGAQSLAQVFTIFPSAGCIGSSGAIFGMIAYSLSIARDSRGLRICSLLALAWYFCIQGLQAWGALTWPFGIAYAAHFGGICLGMTLGLAPQRKELCSYVSRSFRYCSQLYGYISKKLRR